jgi:hypothetical protein
MDNDDSNLYNTSAWGPLRHQEEGTKMKNASVLQVEDYPDDEALSVDL